MNDVIVDGNSLFARCWYAVKAEPKEAAEDVRYFGSAAYRPGIDSVGLVFQLRARCSGGTGSRRRIRSVLQSPKAYIDTRFPVSGGPDVAFQHCPRYHAEFEADDVVATATYASKADRVYVVASGDKDLMQLQGGMSSTTI
jgi:hypothetical protein